MCSEVLLLCLVALACTRDIIEGDSGTAVCYDHFHITTSCFIEEWTIRYRSGNFGTRDSRSIAEPTITCYHSGIGFCLQRATCILDCLGQTIPYFQAIMIPTVSKYSVLQPSTHAQGYLGETPLKGMFQSYQLQRENHTCTGL